jgi:hypothetical protein
LSSHRTISPTENLYSTSGFSLNVRIAGDRASGLFVEGRKEFRKSYITREKVGYKFGEFAYSRKKNDVKKKFKKVKKK